MNWNMHLEAIPMERIRSGLKQVEFRLDKPKWRDIAVGDTVTFTQEANPDETLIVRVLELMRFPTFRDLLTYCELRGLLEECRSIDEQVRRLETRYPAEERAKYERVFGLRVEAIL
ncbi:MAG TPA: hypothetical protein VLG69_01135 [Candidatus Andersenbacteria bacterium]|nr:hypothetical protein [Candidatus Andersenbacteria bacterium]